MTVHDKTLSPRFVNLFGSFLSLLLIGLPLWFHAQLWSENPLDAWYSGASTNQLTWLLTSLALFFLSIIIHEALHGLGYALAGLKRAQIRFGFQWRNLLPYAHAAAPMPLRGYRLAVALPGLVLGLLPLIYGLVTGAEGWSFFGAVLLAAAVGDIIILALTWGLAPTAIIQDHPSKPGFQILNT